MWPYIIYPIHNMLPLILLYKHPRHSNPCVYLKNSVNPLQITLFKITKNCLFILICLSSLFLRLKIEDLFLAKYMLLPCVQDLVDPEHYTLSRI